MKLGRTTCSIGSMIALLALACGGRGSGGSDNVMPACGTPGTSCIGAAEASTTGATADSIVPDPDTCADNPRLVGCTAPVPGLESDLGQDQAPPPMGSDDPTSELTPGSVVANDLLANCGTCHGPALTPEQAGGGINYIGDIDELVANGELVPLNSAGSPIIRLMKDGEMPPPSSGLPQMADSDISILELFIDNPRFWPGY